MAEDRLTAAFHGAGIDTTSAYKAVKVLGMLHDDLQQYMEAQNRGIAIESVAAPHRKRCRCKTAPHGMQPQLLTALPTIDRKQ